MPKTPNLLLLFTDQHRREAVGCYDASICKTPHIDGLAAEGVRFDRAYTPNPVCTPARASVLTGLYPHAHGMTANTGETSCAVHNLRDHKRLLSRRLETAGYACGYSGKWHLGTYGKAWGVDLFGYENTGSLPEDVGFEGHQFHDHGGPGIKYSAYHRWLEAKGYKLDEVLDPSKDWPWPSLKPWAHGHPPICLAGELTIPAEATVPYFLADNTIALMERYRKAGKPFFIWHNFWGPHDPYYVPSDYVDLYRDVEIPPWPNWQWPARSMAGAHHLKVHPDAETLPWEAWADQIRYYFAYTTLIDDQVGRILDYMRETGLLEETAVAFTCDHGETLGSHGGLVDKGFCHFEETHRIPFILRDPAGRWAGTARDEFVSLTDILPTFVDYAGAPCAESEVHGASLKGLLEGTRTEPWRDAVVTEFGGLGGTCVTQRTLVMGNLKYGYNAAGGDELYDLAKDPHEMRNSIDDPKYAADADRLRRRLDQWMGETKDSARGYYRKHCARLGTRL